MKTTCQAGFCIDCARFSPGPGRFRAWLPMGFVMPDLVRVVVAIDPAANSGEDARL
jgi:hypothetical protein